jgi:hypothetical protein
MHSRVWAACSRRASSRRPLRFNLSMSPWRQTASAPDERQRGTALSGQMRGSVELLDRA